MAHPGWIAVGRYLVRERRARGLRSRREFAAQIRLSESTLDHLEHGERENYSTDTIAAVEIALSWEPGSLERVVAGGRPQRIRDPELDELIRIWQRLPAEARRMLLSLARSATGR